MRITRLAKIAMCLALGLFCLVVTYDNIVDYGTNYVFVQHTLSMDTIPAGGLRDRAITNPLLWQLAYAGIIATEGATAALFLVGTASLWRTRHATADVFNAAKRYAIAACLLAFLLWFFGFMVVGGEWFAMWQSSTWNGQEPAFRFYVSALAVLIFLNQPDTD